MKKCEAGSEREQKTKTISEQGRINTHSSTQLHLPMSTCNPFHMLSKYTQRVQSTFCRIKFYLKAPCLVLFVYRYAVFNLLVATSIGTVTMYPYHNLLLPGVSPYCSLGDQFSHALLLWQVQKDSL